MRKVLRWLSNWHAGGVSQRQALALRSCKLKGALQKVPAGRVRDDRIEWLMTLVALGLLRERIDFAKLALDSLKNDNDFHDGIGNREQRVRLLGVVLLIVARCPVGVLRCDECREWVEIVRFSQPELILRCAVMILPDSAESAQRLTSFCRIVTRSSEELATALASCIDRAAELSRMELVFFLESRLPDHEFDAQALERISAARIRAHRMRQSKFGSPSRPVSRDQTPLEMNSRKLASLSDCLAMARDEEHPSRSVRSCSERIAGILIKGMDRSLEWTVKQLVELMPPSGLTSRMIRHFWPLNWFFRCWVPSAISRISDHGWELNFRKKF